MLRWLINRVLDSEEKKLRVPVDYLRHIAAVSPGAFFRFAAVMPLVNSRKVLPEDAWFVAQLVALQSEDCGACLQIGVNNARSQGVDAALLRAVLDGDLEAVSTEMADVYRFSSAVVSGSGEESELRETLRARYGERGLIELSYSIASSYIPPVVKRTLGFAESCSVRPVEL